jgi:hypothetical protein
LPVACAQPVDGSQESAVHGLLSLQLMALPPQTPAEHVSFVVHALPSLQAVPFVRFL